MQRTKKRKQPTPLLQVSCNRCEALCYVEWKPFDATTDTASDIMDPALFFFERELYSYTICPDCTPIVEALEQSKEPLTIFTSHINPSVIQSSSHPHIMPICKYLRHPLHAPIQPYVPFDLNEGFQIARSWFQQATYVLVLAGAGMSADAGLSVFRYQLIPTGSSSSSSSSRSALLSTAVTTTVTTTTKPLSLIGGGLTTEEVDYRSHPEKAWYYDASIRRDALSHIPHDGYTILLQALQQQHKDYFIMTSNIDGYFVRQQYPWESMYETHGSVRYLQCGEKPRCHGVWPWLNDVKSSTTRETTASSSSSSLSSSCTTNATITTDGGGTGDDGIGKITTNAQCNVTTSTTTTNNNNNNTTNNKNNNNKNNNNINTTIFIDDFSKTCDLSTTPSCPTCQGKMRANISHEMDDAHDIDNTIKEPQKSRLWGWLRRFRRMASSDGSNKDISSGESNGLHGSNRSGSNSGDSNGVCINDTDHHHTKRSYPFPQPQSVPDTTASNNFISMTAHSTSLPSPSPSSRPLLLILEIGCGDSVHSLRQESELLMSSHPISGLLRKEGRSQGHRDEDGGGHGDGGNGDSSSGRDESGNINDTSSSHVGVKTLDVRLIRVDPLLTPTLQSNSDLSTTTNNNQNPTPLSSLTTKGDTGMVLGLNCTALLALQNICQ